MADKKHDCFVRFFLGQALEIQSETIQSLIDNGYRTKLSLTAMDLNLDLPLISDIPLAQRSLLRKYIAALQDKQPFSVTLTHEPSSSCPANGNTYNQTVPIKKRKYDVYISDQSNENLGNNNSSSELFQNISPRQSFSSQLITAQKQSSQPPRVRVNNDMLFDKMDTEDVTEDDGNLTETLRIEEYEKVGRERGRKSATVRTPSQLRYERIKQIMENTVENVDENQQNDEPIVSESKNRSRGRPSTSRTPSQIRYEKIRKSIQNADTSADISSVSTLELTAEAPTTQSTSKNLTPAERAVLAKIEAKRLAEANKKQTVFKGRTRKTKRK